MKAERQCESRETKMISCDRTIYVGQEVYIFLIFIFFPKKEERKKNMIPSLLEGSSCWVDWFLPQVAYRAMLSASSKALLVVNLNRRRRRLVLM